MSNDGLLLSIPVKALLLNELKIVARDQGCVDFEVIGGIIMTEAPLPRTPKTRRKKVAMRALEHQRAADTKVQNDLDRKAIAIAYSAETEVMLWTPLLDTDCPLTLQGRSTSYCNGRRFPIQAEDGAEERRGTFPEVEGVLDVVEYLCI